MDNPSNIHGLENPSPSDSTHSGQVLPRIGFLEKREEGRAAQMWVWESPGQGGDTAASPETCQDLLLFPNPLFQSHLDRAGKAKLSPSQHLWKISLNNPTNIHCMRFPFLHSPGRTQEKSILQPTAIKHFGVGTKF